MGSSSHPSKARHTIRSTTRAAAFLVVLLLVGALGSAVSIADEETGATGSISGTVTSATTGEPVAAEVTVIDASNFSNRVTVPVGDDGTYQVDDLAAGDYYVEFVPLVDGYYAEFYGGVTEILESTAVAVSADAVTSDIDAALLQPATISGQVRAGDTGEPLALVDVAAYHVDDVDLVGTVTETDGDGNYSLELRPGSYYVQANGGNPGGINGPDAGLLWEYRSKWQLVELGSGEHLVWDVVLPEGPRGSISGTVTDAATGDPVAGVTVTARFSIFSVSTVTAEDGTYALSNLSMDDHLVGADGTAVGYSKIGPDPDDPISLGNNEVRTGVDFELARLDAWTSSISGTVTGSDTGGAGLAGVGVELRSENLDLVINNTVTDEHGTYAMNAPAGNYVLWTNVTGSPTFPGDGHLYLYDGAGTSVSIGAGEHVVVDTTLPAVNRGSISGTVTDAATGEGIEGVTVWADGALVSHTAVTDEDGTYTMADLGAQEYRVSFDGAEVGYGSAVWGFGQPGDDWGEGYVPVSVPFNGAVVGIDAELEALTVTYTARYAGQRCTTIQNFAAGMGLTPAEMIKLGVNGFRGVAEANPGTSYAEMTGTEPGDTGSPVASCEFEVTWNASEAAALESAAAWWGVSVDELHDGGGWLVVVLIYRALVGLD